VASPCECVSGGEVRGVRGAAESSASRAHQYAFLFRSCGANARLGAKFRDHERKASAKGVARALSVAAPTVAIRDQQICTRKWGMKLFCAP